MDIKDIMTDGKIDGNKIYQHIETSRYTCIYEDCDELAEAINAHIATLNQSTPITPELLQRAGFEVSAPGVWLKNAEGVSIIFSGSVFLGEGQSLIKLPHVSTMEALSELHTGLTGRPLNWQHDPAAEVRKRLEAMGFKNNAGNNYRLSLGDTDTADFIVQLDSSLNLSVWLGRMSRNPSGLKTIDALERVVKELKGE
jgi:hypothetical protein